MIIKIQSLDLIWMIVCRWHSPLDDGKHGHGAITEGNSTWESPDPNSHLSAGPAA